MIEIVIIIIFKMFHNFKFRNVVSTIVVENSQSEEITQIFESVAADAEQASRPEFVASEQIVIFEKV